MPHVPTSLTSTLALAAALPLAGLSVAVAAPAFAAGSGQSYQATLSPVPLNGQDSAKGTLTLTLDGNTATIKETTSGLAATFMGKPYPHVQHIHGLAAGTCPTAAADADGNGVIDTGEAADNYGAIQTTLSTSGATSPAAATDLSIAPTGASYQYSRTIDLSADSVKAIRAGSAVIVVHGLDPATAPPAATSEKSALVPSLPLAATAPALCGKLVASQMTAMPNGGAQTGGGSTSGTEHDGLIALGAVALAGGAGALTFRRRREATQR